MRSRLIRFAIRALEAVLGAHAAFPVTIRLTKALNRAEGRV
jgi:hypothetical protein